MKYFVNKEIVFYWSLALLFITLPLPKDSLNSLTIIVLLISWLFYEPLSIKIKNLKRCIFPFIIVSSLFWLYVLGLLYTENIERGFHVLQRNIPFILLPLIICTSSISKKSVHKLFEIFSYAVIAASFFAILKALYFKINNLGDYFYYTKFSKVLDIHTTYFALFTILAIVHFLFKIKGTFNSRTTAKNSVIICYLLGVLYLLSSRISLIALAIVIVVYFIKLIKDNKIGFNLIFIGICMLLTLGLFISPNFNKRNTGISEFGLSAPTLESRNIHWQSVLNTISKSNVIFGYGTGDAHNYLYEEYKALNFTEGYKEEYNAHNQYLEIALAFGLIGIVVLFTMLSFFIFLSLRTNDYYHLTIALVFATFMITESLLERQRGIVSFALFLTLCLCLKVKKKQLI